MSIDLRAAEAAVRAAGREASDKEPASNRGTFRTRQVSAAVAQAHGLSMARRREAVADNGPDEAGKKVFPSSPRYPGPDFERNASVVSRELLVAGLKVGAMRQDIRRTLAASRKRFFESISRQADAVCREDMVRRIELQLPGGSAPTVVESRIVPGAALGACFPNGYPLPEDLDRDDLSRFCHVPDLEQTLLTDRDGALLFSGLRNGFFQVEDLDAGLLTGLSEDRLWQLLANLVVADDLSMGVSTEQTGRSLERMRFEIGAGVRLHQHVREVQRLACKAMVREAAVAAIAGDSEKYRRALDGEIVDVQLLVIASLWNCMDDSSASQWLAFYRAKHDPMRVRLEMRDRAGEPRSVLAKLSVLQFDVSMSPEDPWVGAGERMEARYLVGRARSAEPEGPITSAAADLRDRAKELRSDMRKSAFGRFQAVQRLGVDHAGVLPATNRLLRQETELRRLEYGADTLEQAEQQLRADLFERDTPMGVAETRRAAARLALVAHLMGVTPVLSCAKGAPFAKALDAEIRFLATIAYNRNGHIPPLVRNDSEWTDVRSAFDLP